jgi:MFS family permease
MMKDSAYRKYLLTLLLLLSACNSADRLVLGLVLDDIKLDLQVTDAELGALTGMAFALFYSIVGIPLSRWADRGDRVVLISLTTALWSAAMALCGFVQTLTQLLAIRICVAVGEAGCLPSAISLIADYFTRAQRPRSVAIYLQGGALSLVLAYLVGGWLNEAYGWRRTFMLLGLPGLCLAVVAWITLREPRRARKAAHGASRGAGASGAAPAQPPGPTVPNADFREVCRTLWRLRTFRHLVTFSCVSTFFNVGIAQWQPTFFLRHYGLKTGALGTAIALVYGAGTMAGTYLGGDWASRHAANNERLQFKMMALAYAAVGISAAFIYLSNNLYWALGWVAVWSAAGTVAGAPVYATIQTIVPAGMRATSITIMMLCTNLIGLGLGPLAAGALSDAFRPWAQGESLRYVSLALSPGYLWAAWYLWRAGHTVMADLRSSRERAADRTSPARPTERSAAQTFEVL